jgi:hypothetical protein
LIIVFVAVVAALDDPDNADLAAVPVAEEDDFTPAVIGLVKVPSAFVG